MSKLISAGILLQYQDKFLIGHPTSGTGTTGSWGILKGKVDEGEQLITAAIREFEEESSIDLCDQKYELIVMPYPFYYYQVNKKTVYVFWAIDEEGWTTQRKLSCPSMIEGTNMPEIDDYKWATVDEAIKMVTESQKELFKTVKELIKHK